MASWEHLVCNRPAEGSGPEAVFGMQLGESGGWARTGQLDREPGAGLRGIRKVGATGSSNHWRGGSENGRMTSASQQWGAWEGVRLGRGLWLWVPVNRKQRKSVENVNKVCVLVPFCHGIYVLSRAQEVS